MMATGLVRFCFNQAQATSLITLMQLLCGILKKKKKKKKIQESSIEDIKEDIISNAFGLIDFEQQTTEIIINIPAASLLKTY